MSQGLPAYYLAAVVPDALRGSVCALCRAPVDENYRYCYQCHFVPETARPDLVGFTSYAIAHEQSGTDMYRYKGHPASSQALSGVHALLSHGLAHVRCASRLVGVPPDAVAVMPSRSNHVPGAPSPLQQLCARLVPESVPMIGLQPKPGGRSDRLVHGDAFVTGGCQDRKHVLLIDDTWVSGATVMSAVAAIRQAGAERVTTLVLARWLDKRYRPTSQLLTQAAQVGKWVGPQKACPFTLDGHCPT